MLISEMIAILEQEKTKRGDVEVVLHGHYGAHSTTFEILLDEQVLEKDKLNVWTGICTG